MYIKSYTRSSSLSLYVNIVEWATCTHMLLIYFNSQVCRPYIVWKWGADSDWIYYNNIQDAINQVFIHYYVRYTSLHHQEVSCNHLKIKLTGNLLLYLVLDKYVFHQSLQMQKISTGNDLMNKIRAWRIFPIQILGM